ncbi:MAG: succinyl-diaminopimelate desuccinylase [Magnetococcales bacterium]|nr:succinyl-diaminopimelate desuccinylase [Magnetococcales bacterium]
MSLTNNLSVVDLARQLVQIASVAPVDGGCQEVLKSHLHHLGFTVYPLVFGETHNFYARLGRKGKNFCFAGHTDVVASGPASHWRCPPFSAQQHEGMMIGRGVCDMKGAIAAMVVAVARLLQNHPDLMDHNSLSFLITGDEEGQAVDGTVKVVQWCIAQGEQLDYCLVGEPTSGQRLGDCLKNGRRGSINGLLTVHGRQGHVAYPHLALNPIHLGLPVLDALTHHQFDSSDNPHFPPTSFQWTMIQAGDGATNVIPGQLHAQFNIRFSTEHTPESLETCIRSFLEPLYRAGHRCDLTLQVAGLPFLTQGGDLLQAIRDSIHDLLGIAPELSTGGGTSDARFLSQHCRETIEFGLVGASMHKVDEAVAVDDLEKLALIYQRILEKIFCLL